MNYSLAADLYSSLASSCIQFRALTQHVIVPLRHLGLRMQHSSPTTFFPSISPPEFCVFGPAADRSYLVWPN